MMQLQQGFAICEMGLGINLCCKNSGSPMSHKRQPRRFRPVGEMSVMPSIAAV